MKVCEDAYETLSVPVSVSKTKTDQSLAIGDTGAQMMVCGEKTMKSLGLSYNDLTPVKLTINAANSGKMKIRGSFFAKISAKNGKTGEKRS